MERKSYPSDLTAKQWQLIEPHLPPEKERGRPRTTNLREKEGLFFGGITTPDFKIIICGYTINSSIKEKQCQINQYIPYKHYNPSQYQSDISSV